MYMWNELSTYESDFISYTSLTDIHKQSTLRPPRFHSGYAAVIGDIVASTTAVDRQRVQRVLRQAFTEIDATVTPLQPLRQTIGDEFQALYRTVSSALTATLLLRLRLLGEEVDVRFGVGWGELIVYDQVNAPYGQDGPTWWAARAAIEDVAELERRRETPRGLRTRFVRAAGSLSRRRTFLPHTFWWQQLPLPGMETWLPEPSPLPMVPDELVNAYLVCRDEIVGRMDPRDARLCLALFRGERQAEMAEREGVSQSAVAQRLARSGAHAVVHGTTSLEEWQPWSH